MMVRRMGAGFLAGASSVAALLVLLALMVIAAGFFGLIRDISTQVYGDIPLSAALAQSMGNSLRAMPSYFWSARWGMVSLGVLGILLSIVDQWRVHVVRPWRDGLGYVVTNSLTGVFVLSALYLNNTSLTEQVAAQPIVFNQMSLLLASDWTLLGIGLLISLGLGAIVWAAWQWWYDRWVRWLRVERPPTWEETREAAVATMPSRDDWRSYQDRLMRLKRQDDAASTDDAPPPPTPPPPRSWAGPLVGGMLALAIVLAVLLRNYHSASSALMYGEFWLEPDAPNAVVDLVFPAPPRYLSVFNDSGSGTIDVRVISGTQVVKALNGMTLAGGPGFRSEILDMNGLASGSYRVDTVLREGAGGLIRYIGLYGGGGSVRVSALLLGLCFGALLACGHVLLLELLARRGRAAH